MDENSNQKKLWFKAKRYGWGWYPASWEGWTVMLVYIALLFLFSATIDDNSPFSEVFFTFLLPMTLLTITLIRICYKTGEKPRWRWSNEDK